MNPVALQDRIVAPEKVQLKPWCEIGDWEVWRFSHRPNDLPTEIIQRVIGTGFNHPPDWLVDRLMQIKRSTNPGYIVVASGRGSRRILRVLDDQRIVEVPEKSFKFTQMNWTILVVRRRK